MGKKDVAGTGVGWGGGGEWLIEEERVPLRLHVLMMVWSFLNYPAD